MAKKLPKETQEIIAKYGLTQADVWDCHGTWVIYHKALERIAADNGIDFEPPRIVVSDMEKKHVAILVTGVRPREDGAEITEWSIGEAAPYNSKNSYPFAMAEKRAKDRVILKLLGLHGDFYSEEEADNFKENKPDLGPAPVDGERMEEGPKKKSVYQLKKEGAWEKIMSEMDQCHNEAELVAWKEENKDKWADWPDTYSKNLKDNYQQRILDFREFKGAAE